MKRIHLFCVIGHSLLVVYAAYRGWGGTSLLNAGAARFNLYCYEIRS